MKKLGFVFICALVCCTMAMASDIAFYVGAPNTDGWYDTATQTADVATIIDQTGHLFLDIQQFDDDGLDALGAWMDENADDGEFDILWLMASRPRVVFERPQIMEQVWGQADDYADYRTIDTHVKRIRKKLASGGTECTIETVWGVGYKFVPATPDEG